MSICSTVPKLRTATEPVLLKPGNLRKPPETPENPETPSKIIPNY
jgi:hypothetical protein